VNPLEAKPFTVFVTDPNTFERYRLIDTLQKNGFIVLTFDMLPPHDIITDGLIIVADLVSPEDLPRLKSRCIIVIGDNIDQLVEYLEAGADDFFARPFSLDLLVARLKAILRRSR
jgi:DNA-binding response OmpR family regulator